MRRKNKSVINDYIFIILGTTILAAGVNMFLKEAKLVTGGLAGLAIVIENVSKNVLGIGIPIWLTNIVVNIPLFAISTKQRGLKFGAKSIFAASYLSLAFWYTSFIPTPLPEPNLLLYSIFAAVFIGTGVGLVLRASATTGGTDMAASIIQYKFKNAPIAKIMLGIDSSIILIGLFIFGIERAMYALIAVYITSKVIEAILEGMHFAKAAFIITDKVDIVAEELMKRIERGATGIKAKGMYTKNERNIIYMVVSKKEIMPLQNIVREIDPKAFITIADVREVYGEGFNDDIGTIK